MPALVLRFTSFFAACLACGASRPLEPVDFVNPNIGTIGHLLRATTPTVQLPHGMARVAPVTSPRIRDRYLADKIYGFPAGAATLMPTATEETTPEKIASSFDHDFETATPYYYAVDLEDNRIKAEVTTTAQAIHYRFTFPPASRPRLLLTMSRRGKLELPAPSAVSGHQPQSRMPPYFWAEFTPASESHETRPSGDAIVLRLQPGATIAEVRIGLSYISAEQAHRNLQRELGTRSFGIVKQQARRTWNQALGRIAIDGGTRSQRTIFYTALYRTLSRMTDITEDGRYYSGYDRQVHDAAGHHFYIDDGLWDTYRSAHPLQLLIDAPRQLDMVRSYIRMYEQSGWLPSFPGAEGDRPVMIGHHAAALIADTYSKGYRDFDAATAYAGMRKNATEATVLPWRRGPLTDLDRFYQQHGFFPALAKGEAETVKEVHSFERRQAVAVTLENCYDDWCVAQMAKALGKQDDYTSFLARAHNYEKVFDARGGFMAPRTADGNWVEGFDPTRGGGQGGRDWYAECNAWVYTWHVQHDPAGLIRLMGGRDKFNARLDQLFVEQYGASKFVFLNQFPDMTGLIGLYPQGNEPALHIPYLYNFSGQPWKTQRRVRQIMEVWYNDGPLGICGDEDGGALSSWYVFTAMGFYPVTPGSPVYSIGSPLFRQTRVAVGGGKIFTVLARNVSARNKYVQSATLNGKLWSKPWFPHSAIAAGGTLVLAMGPRPNRSWGTAPGDAPPSMSDQ